LKENKLNLTGKYNECLISDVATGKLGRGGALFLLLKFGSLWNRRESRGKISGGGRVLVSNISEMNVLSEY